MHVGMSVLQACYQAIRQHSFLGAYNDTFDVVRADSEEMQEKIFRLRYQVFCEENNCEQTGAYPDGLLKDAYDDGALHFALVHRETGEVAGAVSVVIPRGEKTEGVFPVQAQCDHPLIHMETEVRRLCEISRLFMAPKFRRRPEDGHFLPAYYEQDWGFKFGDGKIDYFRRQIPYAPLGLLKAVFDTALQNRIMDCVWMVESPQLKALQEIGLGYRVLGPRLNGPVPRQPVIFNIKIALDTMRDKNLHCYELVSDRGRLARLADEQNRNYWQDHVFGAECWDQIYNKFL